jgi:hypothetical protein
MLTVFAPAPTHPPTHPTPPFRDPTPEELEMEKEVKDLQQQLQTLMEAQPGEVDTLEQMKQELDEKERQLYRLQVGDQRGGG